MSLPLSAAPSSVSNQYTKSDLIVFEYHWCIEPFSGWFHAPVEHGKLTGQFASPADPSLVFRMEALRTETNKLALLLDVVTASNANSGNVTVNWKVSFLDQDGHKCHAKGG